MTRRPTRRRKVPDTDGTASETRMEAQAAQSIPAADDRRRQLAQQARRLVGQVFFGAILKQMRNSSFASPVFSGGRGGQAFTAIYEQHLAERMSCGAGRRLAESIARRLESRPSRDAARDAAAQAAYRAQGIEVRR